MKILLVIVVLIGLLVTGGFFYVKDKHFSSRDRGDLERYAEHEINKLFRKSDSRAMVVGIYKKGQFKLWTLGVPRAGSTEAIEPETVFQIGSITKVFTVALLQVLTEEGVVSLESTLGELLGADLSLRPKAAQITLAQLASHTSGLPRIPAVLMKRAEEIVGDGDIMIDPYSHMLPQDMFDYLESAAGLNSPGKYDYSNYGMGLLAHVLEKVAGASYEKLLAEKILKPLEMNDTTLFTSQELVPRMTQGYTAKGTETPPWSFAVLAGAGALNSTGADMMKFLMANLEDTSELGTTLGSIRVKQTDSNIRLGWIGSGLFDRLLGIDGYVWHNGMTGGYASYIAVDERHDSGVFVLSNEAVSVDLLGMMLTHRARYQSWAVD